MSSITIPLVSLISISLLLLSPVAASDAVSEPPSPAGAPIEEPTNHMVLLAPILANLGYQELAMAVTSSPLLRGPVTLFAASDDSLRSCASTDCSQLGLLRDHLVPGLFPLAYLSRLNFGTRLETSNPGRCLIVTSTAGSAGPKVFVDGIEITRPDLFNDGQILIHGLQGFVSPLSPDSCRPIWTPIAGERRAGSATAGERRARSALVRLMLRDAIVRLAGRGYNVLALAMRVKYAELSGLSNMTVFALDDQAIFGGGQSYVSSVRFHIVPNRILVHADLARMREGTILPTLIEGQHLVVTHAGGPWPLRGGGVRVNFVPIGAPDVIYNTRIAVHGIAMPFPHLVLPDLASTTAADGGIFDGPMIGPWLDGKSPCGLSGNLDGCDETPADAPPSSEAVDSLDDEPIF